MIDIYTTQTEHGHAALEALNIREFQYILL